MYLRSIRSIGLTLALVVAVLTSRPSMGQQTKSGGDKYALLVGVRRYDPNELRALPYSEPDVVDLAAVLKAEGYKPGNVVLMTQTAGAEDTRLLPLAANVRKELKLLLDVLDEDDSVLIALAGHGVQFQGENESYFCPADARLADRSSLIPLSEIYKVLEKSPAGLKVLLVDACRNDPQSQNSRARDVVKLESVTRPQRTLPQEGGPQAFERPAVNVLTDQSPMTTACAAASATRAKQNSFPQTPEETPATDVFSSGRGDHGPDTGRNR